MASAHMTLKAMPTGSFPPMPDGIPLLQFEHVVAVPRQLGTMQATGKRQHQLVRVLHEVNQWSPFLFRSLATNEQFSSVVIEFDGPGDDGLLAKRYEVRLTDAFVSSFRTYTEGDQFLSEVLFAFQTMEHIELASGNLGKDSVV